MLDDVCARGDAWVVLYVECVLLVGGGCVVFLRSKVVLVGGSLIICDQGQRFEVGVCLFVSFG